MLFIMFSIESVFFWEINLFVIFTVQSEIFAPICDQHHIIWRNWLRKSKKFWYDPYGAQNIPIDKRNQAYRIYPYTITVFTFQ